MQIKLPPALHVVGSLLLVAVIAGAVSWWSLYLNRFAVTPDIAGLACAGDYLAKTGEFRDYPIIQTTYEMCWQPDTYPLLQRAFALVERITGISNVTLAHALTVFSYIGVVLLIWLVTWQLSHRIWLAALGAGLAIFTPALVRAMLLTPQNVVGYMLLLGVISCLLAFNKKRQWLYALPVVGIWGVTYFTHTLTFAVMSLIIGVWFLAVAVKPWWLQLTLTTLGVIALVSQFVFQWLPTMLAEKLDFFLHGSTAGFDHPLWDHPAIWGYLILALAAVGFCLWPFQREIQRAQKITLAVVALVPTLLGHATIFGVGLLPNRFIPFTWLALTPLAALGAIYLVIMLFSKMKAGGWWSGIVLGMIMTAQVAHGLFFMIDDLSGLAYRYTPKEGYVEALTWLNEYDNEATVMGVQSAENQEILVAPLWYDGLVRYYPWYALNHRDIKKFAVINKASSPYTNVVTNPADPVYPWLFRSYTLVAKPNSPEAATTIETDELDYFLTSKQSKVYTEVWINTDPERYPIIYENNHYIIYAL